MAGRVEEVTTARGVEVEEDAGDDNDLLLQTSLEEVEAVRDGTGETLEVQPQVEGRVGNVFDDEAHFAQAPDHVVTLVLEAYQPSMQRRNKPLDLHGSASGGGPSQSGRHWVRA